VALFQASLEGQKQLALYEKQRKSRHPNLGHRILHLASLGSGKSPHASRNPASSPSKISIPSN
jgi:hypothetical protein